MQGVPVLQPRWSVFAEVVPKRAKLSCRWNAVNISKSGVFVAGNPVLKAGSKIDVVLHLPGAYGPSVELDGRVEVVWNRGPEDATTQRPSGMGCRFISLDGNNRANLDAYIEELRQSRPADSGKPKSAPPPIRTPKSKVEPFVERSSSEDSRDRLGPYTLMRKLGSGGMGEVFLAEHRLIGRRVAIKRLNRQIAEDPISVRNFFEEARLVNQISHPNIVEITDLVSANDTVYYVMEYIEGTTLLQVLRDGIKLPLRRILRIGLQLADALTAVHAAGIVHRDLKPDNVILTERYGRRDFVKLLDFGIASLRSAKKTSQTTNKKPAKNNLVTGTPGYMSPEQMADLEVDHRSDIYALGVLLHEMVSGKRAFTAPSVSQLMLKQSTELPAPPMPSANYALPQLLERLIMNCLAISPKERPASIREVTHVLRAVLDQSHINVETLSSVI